MRKVKELLQLHLLGRVSSRRQLGRAVGCGKTAVSDYLRRAAIAGLTSWEAVLGLDEEELERRLYPRASSLERLPPLSKHQPSVRRDWQTRAIGARMPLRKDD
jgi:hypothetical protein